MSKVYQQYLSAELIGPSQNANMIIDKNTTYSHICPDCSHDKCSSERNRSRWKQEIVSIDDPIISYRINNYGYRSDDISKEHSTSNFLYSGCSNTFGIGVPLESIWAYQINSLLSGEKFINLAINGGSYKTVIYDVFNYIRNFGKPKGVFLLLPNLQRQINFIENKEKNVVMFINSYRNSSQEENISRVISEKTNLFEFYNTVKMLEDYLFELDIPLIWTTWDPDLDKKISESKGFKNYVTLDNFNVYHKLKSSKKPKELDNDYWDVARDNSHLGSKYHLFYASIMYDEWKNKYEKNNQ